MTRCGGEDASGGQIPGARDRGTNDLAISRGVVSRPVGDFVGLLRSFPRVLDPSVVAGQWSTLPLLTFSPFFRTAPTALQRSGGDPPSPPDPTTEIGDSSEAVDDSELRVKHLLRREQNDPPVESAIHLTPVTRPYHERRDENPDRISPASHSTSAADYHRETGEDRDRSRPTSRPPGSGNTPSGATVRVSPPEGQQTQRTFLENRAMFRPFDNVRSNSITEGAGFHRTATGGAWPDREGTGGDFDQGDSGTAGARSLSRETAVRNQGRGAHAPARTTVTPSPATTPADEQTQAVQPGLLERASSSTDPVDAPDPSSHHGITERESTPPGSAPPDLSVTNLFSSGEAAGGDSLAGSSTPAPRSDASPADLPPASQAGGELTVSRTTVTASGQLASGTRSERSSSPSVEPGSPTSGPPMSLHRTTESRPSDSDSEPDQTNTEPRPDRQPARQQETTDLTDRIDLDRLADQLTRKLDRRERIERERRGR